KIHGAGSFTDEFVIMLNALELGCHLVMALGPAPIVMKQSIKEN
ncbi:MAG: hypothetical protein ACJAS3_003054, partial [Roseivirga sp.]